jgi:hypothetical protein
MTEPAPATDAEIETFRIHAESHDRAKFYGHEMLRILARLDAERAAHAETRVLAADNLAWFEEAKRELDATRARLATAREALHDLITRPTDPAARQRARAALDATSLQKAQTPSGDPPSAGGEG